MNFEVYQMTFPQDQSIMDEIVFTVFLPDMPLMQLFNVNTDPSLPTRLPSPHQPTPHSQDLYLKAVASSGDVIGIAISKEHVTFSTDSNTPPEWFKMVEFMDYVEEESHIHELPGRTIELFVLCVHRDWRKHGVAKRLTEECMRLAKAAGFTTMKIVCANEFTARLVKNLGWQEVYRLVYKDYARMDLEPSPPHETIYIYKTQL